MALDGVRLWLVEHQSFQAQLDAVVLAAVYHDFPAVKSDVVPAVHDWPYLLLCASVLARSEKVIEQRAALRIADTCLQLRGTSAEAKAAAVVILDTMANHRALELATARRLVARDLLDNIPLPLQGDMLRRATDDAVQTSEGKFFSVNRFQKNFWNALRDAEWVSASAPTSAGKSFLLRLWVRDIFSTSPKAKVAFIVPTRALIQEISDAFGDDQAKGDLKNVVVHTLPLETGFAAGQGHLLVYTQERLHVLLGRDKHINFDVVIVDEAQKIGEGYRGVLLEQVIGECRRRAHKLRLVFASPHIANPAYFIEGSATGIRSLPVDRQVTTVSQNLLFVTQKPGNPLKWAVESRDGNKALPVGEIELKFRPTSEAKRLTAVAFALRSESGGNLVYANGQADAEKYASQLAEACAQCKLPTLESHPRVRDLIHLIQKTVHRHYALVETVKHGVGFHYGNMPLLIRVEVEALFRENILRFLVCTSTLMEGVNLPCKVIFLRGPKRGRAPLTPADFWNLAGRAGRWGTEFQGSIVCVDALRRDVWKEPPPVDRVRQAVTTTTERGLADGGGLLEYIHKSFPADVSNDFPEYDYAISHLLSVIVRGENLNTLPAIRRLADTAKNELDRLLRAEIEHFTLPHELLFRNPGVLPRAMTNLLVAFQSLDTQKFSDLVPVLPESQDALPRYKSVFEFINVHLRANWAMPGQIGEKRLWQLAYLTVDWMRGRPLAYLINRRITLNKKGKNQTGLPAIIRNVMSDVEEYARFKIPRFLRCYLDVLTFHAQQSSREESLQNLPDLELWLELGVSVRTALALMELGLSRTSAIELFELMMNTEMTKEQILAWLKERDVDTMDLPILVRNEIRKVLTRYTVG
jgi:hypothetical protein